MRRNRGKKGVNVVFIVLVIIFLALFVLRRTEQVGVRRMAPVGERSQ
jgi:succinate-acetate transporter protein